MRDLGQNSRKSQVKFTGNSQIFGKFNQKIGNNGLIKVSRVPDSNPGPSDRVEYLFNYAIHAKQAKKANNYQTEKLIPIPWTFRLERVRSLTLADLARLVLHLRSCLRAL